MLQKIKIGILKMFSQFQEFDLIIITLYGNDMFLDLTTAVYKDINMKDVFDFLVEDVILLLWQFNLYIDENTLTINSFLHPVHTLV